MIWTFFPRANLIIASFTLRFQKAQAPLQTAQSKTKDYAGLPKQVTDLQGAIKSPGLLLSYWLFYIELIVDFSVKLASLTLDIHLCY